MGGRGPLREGPGRLAPRARREHLLFDTGGGTQHITQSKDTVSSHAPSGSSPPDFSGAIGVTADGVEGVDVTVPVFQFSETHYFTNDQVTPSYKGTLFSLTGKVNAGPFKGFQAGEVLFLGASTRAGRIVHVVGLEAVDGQPRRVLAATRQRAMRTIWKRAAGLAETP